MSNNILVDGRWQGSHGIGRFSSEVLNRLTGVTILREGPPPLSMRNLFWQSVYLMKNRSFRLFYTPGFNPPLISPLPFVFTIHDLIHLQFGQTAKMAKRLFYNTVIKRGAHQAAHIITVSQYSKQAIMDWAGLPAEKITVVDSGISPIFSVHGTKHDPGYPYLLHVANNKPHKNASRLIEAFGTAKLDTGIKLICTYPFTSSIMEIIRRHRLESRVLSCHNLTEQQLAAYYRGALGVAFPSLLEGFGLPVLEGMASDVPVLTSNITSLPEIAGDAAILVDPYDVAAIANGLETLVLDTTLRGSLIARGHERIKLYSWEKTALKVQEALLQTSI